MILKNRFLHNRIQWPALTAMTFLLVSVFLTGTAFGQETPESDDSAGVAAEVKTDAENASAKDFMDDVNAKLEEVDAFVGENIVSPMAGVIFNGLWTGDYEQPKVDEAGQPVIDPVTGEQVIEKQEGWLGDGSVSVPFIVVWLFVGAVFFTLFMGFINVRGFWHAIRLTKGDYDNPDDHGEVTHFQALSSALSGTVGLGNIAGVAIAIGQGGPGATFWMILVGLLGMSTKFTECTLGQMYRREDKRGRVSGGPMRYLSAGLKEKGLGPLGSLLAVMFAILCIGGSFGGGNTFQISQSLDAIRTEAPILNQYSWIYGLIMAIAVGLVIVGGIKSIGKVASRIVPFMCAGYVLCVLYILGTRYTDIPAAFQSIWDGAFNFEAGYGAFLGCLVIGIKRAVFSNEAGTGSASIAHSAAKTDVPVREGYVALLEPFIDTVVVCTMTALVIIITGVISDKTQELSLDTIQKELSVTQIVEEQSVDVASLSRLDAEKLLIEANSSYDADGDGTLTVGDMVALDRGAYFTKQAFVEGGFEWFKWFLFLAIVLFAFSTCISWAYYGERCFTALFGDWSSGLFKILFLTFTFLGAVIAPTSIKDFSDMMILGMAFPNMLGMYFLSGNVRRHLNEYVSDLKAGKYDRN
ncbi:alanine/glycine:cation symporter family protein [Mariniblastus fucicola]|uniref:Amino-acid carrier protein AlsT n=1 Tax=Mariniblastus fucicola TaxID=980251 RepID=A0A5B9P6P7_9BACT|nr:alanine/glycine:cation symporter family protein [Mariniblastus fucicola]QEG20855.1 Amino-acid carrier protein AlsT [Mariniblastus fucicola]